MSKQFIFTSESVSEGHPDKVADQISDAILDQYLKTDPHCRVACETVVKNSSVIVAGEITSVSEFDPEKVVRDVIRQIGYDDPQIGFDSETADVHFFLSRQSPDIAMGVDEGEGLHKEQGAGDQGLMFGFACKETQELMPLPISLAHGLMHEVARHRKLGKNKFLRPDAKSQVSVLYENGTPKEIDTVVISSQHTDDISLKDLEEYMIEEVIKAIVPHNLLTSKTKFLINPTGRFVIGGPVGDCGLTGRKIIVDTYGGYSRHGGGAFSGKDPSKVDRSAAYMARNIAKNIVAADLASKCEVQVAYAIGVAKPVSIYVDTFNTGVVPETQISNAIGQVFDLTPKGIIRELELLKPIYQETAAYGHFGRTPTTSGHFSWERADRVSALKQAIG
jgi:S-adenosylmethionine synthetase